MRRRIAWLFAAGLCLAAPATAPAAAPGRPGQWIAVNDAMLRYELTGAGRGAVVLIHDPGLNLEEWDEVLPAIQPGRRVLRYDLKGMGLSEKVRRIQTIDEQIADLRGLLYQLGVAGPVVLVGGTSSAAIALKFAALYPDAVEAVVAINPNTRIKPTHPPLNPTLAAGKDMREVMSKEGVRAFLASQADWLYPPEIRTKRRFDRFMGSQVAQDPFERASFMYIRNSAVDIEGELPKVRCPTLIVAGMLNSSYTADEWRSIAGAIPHARLEMVRTGHYAAIESPELIAPLLADFLRGVEKGR